MAKRWEDMTTDEKLEVLHRDLQELFNRTGTLGIAIGSVESLALEIVNAVKEIEKKIR